MGKSRFHGLYLQNTGHPLYFSFVTYTRKRESRWSPVEIWVKMRSTSIRLFLISFYLHQKGSLGGPMLIFSQSDMMMSRLLLQRKRGSGIQHEYLIEIKQDSWNESMDSALSRLRAVMSDESWKGSPIHHFE